MKPSGGAKSVAPAELTFERVVSSLREVRGIWEGDMTLIDQ